MATGTISDHLIRTARAVLGMAVRNAAGRGSAVYSALLASLLHEELKTELQATPAHEVGKHDLLTDAIERCQQAAASCPEGAVEELRAVLVLLEKGKSEHADTAAQDRRGKLRVIEGGLPSTSARLNAHSERHLRLIG